MIELYTSSTPNGWKVSILLEEIGLPYKVNPIKLQEGDQKKPNYLKVNPNGRIPAIIDTEADITVFESGACMLYLAEKSGQLLPTDLKEKYNVMQWLMWQMGGVGPMQGQANVFYRYFPEKIPAAIERYQNECRRLFEVLDTQLSDGREYITGEYSIADIANFSWIHVYEWAGINTEGLNHLHKWIDRIADRPAVKRGLAIPEPLNIRLADADDDAKDKFIEDAQKMLQR